MRIRLSLSDTPHKDTLTVYVEGKNAHRQAKDDQTIMGSRWECPSDMPEVAYAMIDNRKTIIRELRDAGYQLAGGRTDNPWSPPIASCQEAHCNDPHCPWKDA